MAAERLLKKGRGSMSRGDVRADPGAAGRMLRYSHRRMGFHHRCNLFCLGSYR